MAAKNTARQINTTFRIILNTFFIIAFLSYFDSFVVPFIGRHRVLLGPTSLQMGVYTLPPGHRQRGLFVRIQFSCQDRTAYGSHDLLIRRTITGRIPVHRNCIVLLYRCISVVIQLYSVVKHQFTNIRRDIVPPKLFFGFRTFSSLNEKMRHLEVRACP